MSPKTPVLSGPEVIRILQRAGYVFDRQKGSHVYLWSEDKKCAVAIPSHGQRDIPPGTFRNILRQAGLTLPEFITLMNK